MCLLQSIRTLAFNLTIVALFLLCADRASAEALKEEQPLSPIELTPEILGEDTDADGIRDDVQIYINDKYKGQPKAIEGFRRLALLVQREVEAVNDRESVIALQKDRMKVMACVWDGLPYQEQFFIDSHVSKFDIEFFNTSERAEVWLRIRTHVSYGDVDITYESCD